jgi:hypothetical protein
MENTMIHAMPSPLDASVLLSLLSLLCDWGRPGPWFFGPCAHTPTHTLTGADAHTSHYCVMMATFPLSLAHIPTPCITHSLSPPLHQEWQFLGYETPRVRFTVIH